MDNTIRLQCVEGHEWPKHLIHFTEVLDNFDKYVDTAALLKKIEGYNKQEDIIVSLVTKEYLGVAKLWLTMLNRLGIQQYIVIAGDKESGEFLDSLNAPNCRVLLKKSPAGQKQFVSPTGFNEKAIAISAFKFLFVRYFIEQGFNVVLSDIDALFLKKTTSEYYANADVAFQRIIHFPKTIAELWSFAACGGFFRFSSSNNGLTFINRAIDVMRTTYEDQIALNVALWESNLKWTADGSENYVPFNHEQQDRMQYFKETSYKSFDGISDDPAINVRALPAQTFYRNDLAPLDLSRVVIFHPNSPKTDDGKLEVFKKHGFFIE